MEMDFNAYLASSDEDCDDEEVWPAVGEGNRNLTEEEKIAKYRVRLYLLLFGLKSLLMHLTLMCNQIAIVHSWLYTQ